MNEKETLEGHSEIARLAIVANDFSTFYVPHITNVGGSIVKKITETIDEFHCFDESGRLISRIKKDCPHLVDYYPFQATKD
ncbi:hypothetical protein LCGC14_0770860 [marine sediment metagenome]|uniref:Uncharacterized protein n=1 Tax=marine sediment metagenome TaxID=412755 RepID=A0A0F9T552_9ZZZZ